MGADQSDRTPDSRFYRRLVILFFILTPVLIIAGIMAVRYISGRKEAVGQAVHSEYNSPDAAGGTRTDEYDTKFGTTKETKKTGHDSADTVTNEAISTAVNTVTLPEGATLDSELPPEITELFLGYFATKLTGDAEAVNRYFTGGAAADPEEESRRLQWSLEYIEDYREISCRAVPGPEAESFIVYAYYKIKFYQSEVPAPSLSVAYVKKDGEGICRIFDGVRDEGLKNYMEQVEQLDSVKELARQVQDEYAQALLADGNLAKLNSIAMAGPESGAEESAGTEDSAGTENKGSEATGAGDAKTKDTKTEDTKAKDTRTGDTNS